MNINIVMVPCSFDQERRYEVQLRPTTIAEAWGSEVFERFRDRMRGACPGCSRREACLGGCPLMPGVVLCTDEHRAVASDA